MEITEVRARLMSNRSDKLQAFCSITLDDQFVIRDLKVIEGGSGPFVAMPSRKLTDRCPKCGSKNYLRAKFCGDCGTKLNASRGSRDSNGKIKYHADVAHPINSICREIIQKRVLEAFTEELEKSKNEDYKPADFDDLNDWDGEKASAPQAQAPPQEAPKRQAPQPRQAPAAREEREPASNDFSDGLKKESSRPSRQRRSRPARKPAQAAPAAQYDSDFEVFHSGGTIEPDEPPKREPAPEPKPAMQEKKPQPRQEPQRAKVARPEPAPKPAPESAPKPAPVPTPEVPAPQVKKEEADGFGSGIF